MKPKTRKHITIIEKKEVNNYWSEFLTFLLLPLIPCFVFSFLLIGMIAVNSDNVPTVTEIAKGSFIFSVGLSWIVTTMLCAYYHSGTKVVEVRKEVEIE